MPSPDHRLPLAEGAALALVAVACLWFQARLPSHLPTEADDQALAAALQANVQPGDVVLLHPWWAERARSLAADQLPITGYQGSERDDLDAFARIWVLEQPELPGFDGRAFDAAFLPGRTAEGEAKTFGHYRLTAYRNGRYHPRTFSAQAALSTARVGLEGPQGRQDCSFDGRAHRCPNGEVAVEWHEIRFQPRRCIRFYPPGGDTRLVAEFSNVPAGDALLLRGGLTWDRGFEKTRSNVEVHAEVNGAPSAQLTVVAGVEGLMLAKGGPVPEGATVRLWTQTANPELRELCVELDVVKEHP
ncbi:MAG: hypothetical protein K1X89_00325 [Myxococcaceae bacterium]|nr:hypothetical protein [Myxococcaceae bacterium]